MLKITKINRELGYMTGMLFFNTCVRGFWVHYHPICYTYLKERIKWN